MSFFRSAFPTTSSSSYYSIKNLSKDGTPFSAQRGVLPLTRRRSGSNMAPVDSLVSERDDTAAFRDVRDRDGNLVLGVASEALRVLETLERDGIKAISGLGLEIGGLLIGRMPAWDHAPVTWTGCVPVEIEYKFGPGFRPSPADYLTFRNASSRHSGSARSQVIGYFRSDLSDSVSIRDEDQWLLRYLFAEKSFCVVLVGPGNAGRSTVHFYRRTREAKPQFVIEFPLGGAPRLAEVPLPRASQPQELPAADSDCWMVVPVEPTGFSRWKWHLWIGLGVLIACLALALAYFAGLRSRPGALPIGLHVESRGSTVEVKWNSTSAPVKGAVRGSLVIVDASQSSRVELNAAQLRLGTYVFSSPSRADLKISMIIYEPDDTFLSENHSVHRGLVPATAQPVSPAPRIAVPPKQTATPSYVPQPIAANKGRLAADFSTPAPPRPTAAPKAKEEVPSPLPMAGASRQTPNPKPDLTFPLPGSAAAGDSGVTPPPDATLAPPAVVKAPTLPEKPVIVKTPPAPENTTPSMPERQRAETTPAVPQPVSTPPAQLATAPSTGAGFVPPQVVHQVTPALPLGVASRIRTEVQIDVMVTVDLQGKVIGARVVSRKGAAAGLLSNEALKAAQLFRFRPAQDNSQNVQSDMVLTFRFPPTEH